MILGSSTDCCTRYILVYIYIVSKKLVCFISCCGFCLHREKSNKIHLRSHACMELVTGHYKFIVVYTACCAYSSTAVYHGGNHNRNDLWLGICGGCLGGWVNFALGKIAILLVLFRCPLGENVNVATKREGESYRQQVDSSSYRAVWYESTYVSYSYISGNNSRKQQQHCCCCWLPLEYYYCCMIYSRLYLLLTDLLQC